MTNDFVISCMMVKRNEMYIKWNESQAINVKDRQNRHYMHIKNDVMWKTKTRL